MQKFKTSLVLKSNVPFKNYLFASLILALLTIISVLILQTKLPPEVPLFYGAAEGEAQVAPSWTLILPSLFSFAVIIINFVIATLIKEDFVKRVLIVSAMVVTLFSVVTTVKIILLVGSF